MPELPEVEVVRRGVERHALGRRIATVCVYHSRPLRRHLRGPDDFAARLVGRQLVAAHRRGKYLWFALDPAEDGEAIVAHLGMSGQFLLQPVEASAEPHLRVRIGFADDGPELRYVDQRMFGGMFVDQISPLTVSSSASPPNPPLASLPATLQGPELSDQSATAEATALEAPASESAAPARVASGAQPPDQIAHIAPDPLDPVFDDAVFLAALRRRRTGVKRALLDQSLVSGVGNIYADEALWQARLHYARPTETLRRPEVTRVLEALRAVMALALEAGGTSFDALYVNVNGESGYFERSLAVYGRAGEPCSRCGRPIRRDPFMNRSSYTCPRCQPRPRRARW